MRAIKIGVLAQQVTEIDLPEPRYPEGEAVKQKGEIIGFTGMLPRMVEAIGRGPIVPAYNFGRGDVLYVNGDALLQPPEQIPGWFQFEGIPQPLAYNGVIVNETTKLTRPPKITVAEVAARVRFLGKTPPRPSIKISEVQTIMDGGHRNRALSRKRKT